MIRITSFHNTHERNNNRESFPRRDEREVKNALSLARAREEQKRKTTPPPPHEKNRNKRQLLLLLFLFLLEEALLLSHFLSLSLLANK